MCVFHEIDSLVDGLHAMDLTGIDMSARFTIAPTAPGYAPLYLTGLVAWWEGPGHHVVLEACAGARTWLSIDSFSSGTKAQAWFASREARLDTSAGELDPVAPGIGRTDQPGAALITPVEA